MGTIIPNENLTLIGKAELAGKLIDRVEQAKWKGATVIYTKDNCVCVLYTTLDNQTGTFDNEEMVCPRNFVRQILGKTK